MNPHTGETKRMKDLIGDEVDIFKPITNKKANEEASRLLNGEMTIIPDFKNNPHLDKERKRMLMQEYIDQIEKTDAYAATVIQRLKKANYGAHAIYEKLVKKGLVKKIQK